MKNEDHLHSVTLELSSPQPQLRCTAPPTQEYLSMMEKALSVDHEIDEINVTRDISHTEDSIIIKVHQQLGRSVPKK